VFITFLSLQPLSVCLIITLRAKAFFTNVTGAESAGSRSLFYYIRIQREQWSAASLRQSEILGLNDSSGGISLVDILPPRFGNSNVTPEDN
jgi:hypothetical protein